MAIYSKKGGLTRDGKMLLNLLQAKVKECKKKIGLPEEEMDRKQMSGNCGDNNFHLVMASDGLKELYTKILRKTEAAIEALRKKEYGFCGECGEEIPIARLNALPFADLCVECQEQKEATQKRRERESPKSTSSFAILEGENPFAAAEEE